MFGCSDRWRSNSVRITCDNRIKRKSSVSELDLVEIEQTKAIAKCIKQIAANPQSARLYADLGDLYCQQQQWQLAIKSYRQALEMEPDLAAVHLSLAMVLERRGNNSLASNHLFEALQLQPQAFDSQQRYQLGQALKSQNKPAKAIACYRQAIESQPDFERAYKTLADLLLQQGKSERAIEVYRLGVKHNPQNSDYTFALASALAAQKKWVCVPVIIFNVPPNSLPAPKYIHSGGIAKYELGEYAAAQTYLQQAVELEPTAQTYYYLGLVWLELKQQNWSDRAESCWKKAIALKKDYILPYYQLGLLWQDQQQWQEAPNSLSSDNFD